MSTGWISSHSRRGGWCSKPAGKRVVKNIVLGVDFAKVIKERVIDPTFGKGEALIASNAWGGSISLVLYVSQPFVFIKQTVKNKQFSRVNC